MQLVVLRRRSSSFFVVLHRSSHNAHAHAHAHAHLDEILEDGSLVIFLLFNFAKEHIFSSEKLNVVESVSPLRHV